MVIITGRALRWVSIFLLLILGGCTSTTFIYNRLDFFIPWYLRDYVDLSAEQRDYFDELLSPLLEWHRTEELPRYVLIIESLLADLGNPVEPATIAQTSAEFEAAWARLESRAIEKMMLLGAELTDAQMQEFLERLAEKQMEYEEEYLNRSDEDYYRESYDNLKDSAGDYLGKLSKAQKRQLETASAQLQRSDRAWLAERAIWQNKLADILQREEGWQEALRDALDARDETVSDQYTEVYEYNLGVIQAALADLLNSRTDKQDRRLRSKLGDLREDFQSLHENGQD